MANELPISQIIKTLTALAAGDWLVGVDISDTTESPNGSIFKITSQNALKSFLGQVDAGGNAIVNLDSTTYDEDAAAATPAAGHVVLYAKTDGRLYSKDDAGLETLVSGGAGGGLNAVVDDVTPELGGELDALANNIVNVLSQEFDEATAPATPPAGHVVIYAKADGLIYSKDDAGVETLMSGGAGGADTQITLTGVTAFTASGTWTKPANLHSILVIMTGGGAGGGGAQATGVGEYSVGAGGAGGDFAMEHILDAALSATETVTCGAGGAGNSGAAGSNGAQSTFGALLTAAGSNGGGIFNASSSPGVATAGTGFGISSDGDLNVRGKAGGHGLAQFGNYVIPGTGGDSFFGGGQRAIPRSTGGGNGAAGVNGGGGAGAGNTPSQGSARTGGAGGAGVCVVLEFTEV